MTTQTKTTWQKVKLGEIANFQYGYTASAQDENTGTKLLRITDIVPDLIDWDTVPYCAIDEKKLKKFKLKKKRYFNCENWCHGWLCQID